MANKTRICCIDIDQCVVEYLKQLHEVFEGTVGEKVSVKYPALETTQKLLCNYNLPDNLHEYDVLVVDMLNEQLRDFVGEEHRRKFSTDLANGYFIISYPINVFNPRPFGFNILGNLLNNRKGRPVIKIIFQNAHESVDYYFYNEVNSSHKNFKINNYEWTADFTKSVLSGDRVKLAEIKLSEKLFKNRLDEIRYKQTYLIPMEQVSIGSHERKPNVNFVPLLYNSNGDVVSYVWQSKQEIVFMLPQVKDKVGLVKQIFEDFLYHAYSEYFPYVEEHSWINRMEYELPGEQKLREEEERIKHEYDKAIAEVEEMRKEYKEKYNFLHKILTETDDELVKAMIQYLQWLGFENVVNHDDLVEDGKPFEEDIDVDMGDEGLLIVEVKGIGGTSTDKECLQISKIHHRREKDRGKFDVTALYIVNNERGVEPLKRTIPPFNDTQIQDAEDDDRGLAYTWQFYNLFYDIQNGLIIKEEARKRLLTNGLVDLTPSKEYIGKSYQWLKDGTVICVELVGNGTLSVGDYLVYEEKKKNHKVKITSIQIEGQNVKEAKTGKIGIGLEGAVPRNVGCDKDIYVLR